MVGQVAHLAPLTATIRQSRLFASSSAEGSAPHASAAEEGSRAALVGASARLPLRAIYTSFWIPGEAIPSSFGREQDGDLTAAFDDAASAVSILQFRGAGVPGRFAGVGAFEKDDHLVLIGGIPGDQDQAEAGSLALRGDAVEGLAPGVVVGELLSDEQVLHYATSLSLMRYGVMMHRRWSWRHKADRSAL